MVASCGWIIPDPFAIPPTVNPSSETAASFVRVSVVRIASAASAPPSDESVVAASPRPVVTLCSGSKVPMTPVERTSTCSASRSRSLPASAAVASASSSPRSPVAALATPELTTIACGSVVSRCALETTTGAACTRLTVNIAAPTAGTVERTIARSFAARRMPAETPAAANPRAAVTLIRAPPTGAIRPSRAGRARRSRSAPPGRPRPCRGCRARRRRSRCRSRGR